jgi:GAF domain-containing protein
MFTTSKLSADSAANHQLMLENLSGYLDSSLPRISNLANMAAILNYFLDDVSWVGFYLLEEGRLILGPFQGLPACTSISMGHGVCGTAAQKRITLVVPDVEQFPGHIACDAASRSEIVIPILKKDALVGVLDLDSPVLSRFKETEKRILEKAVDLLVDIL